MIGKKTLSIIIVIAIIGLVAYGLVQSQWLDGAPQPTVTIVCYDVQSGTTQTSTVDVESKTLTALGNYELFAIDPTKAYKIGIYCNYNVQVPSEIPAGTPLYGSSILSAYKYIEGYGSQRLMKSPQSLELVTPQQQLTSNYTGIADFSDGFDMVRLTYNPPVASPDRALLGAYLDGMEWTITITTGTQYGGTDAYWGSTVVTFTTSLDTAGNLSMQVDNIDVTATET